MADSNEPASQPESQPTPPEAPTTTDSAPPDKEAVEEQEIGQGSALDDLRLAIRRNTGWIFAIGEFIQALFHYFFVGCASLLGLMIILLIPTAVAAAVSLLLGVPGYLAYRWFGTPGEYVSTLTVIVTIFWSGYFVTHGWPHVGPTLERFTTWAGPGVVWLGRILENLSEEDEEDEPATQTVEATAKEATSTPPPPAATTISVAEAATGKVTEPADEAADADTNQDEGDDASAESEDSAEEAAGDDDTGDEDAAEDEPAPPTPARKTTRRRTRKKAATKKAPTKK